MEDLRLSLEWPAAGVAVVWVEGEVDPYTFPLLRQELERPFACDGLRYLVVDMAAVGYVDSTGLGVMVAVHRRLRDQVGTGLVVAGGEEKIGRILRLTGLCRVFRVVASVEEALSVIEGGQDGCRGV